MRKGILLILLVGLVAEVSMAHPSVGILEDKNGNVFYTDLKQVWKISPSGEKSVVVPNVHTHELYIDDNDNVYGEHLWYNGEQRNTWGHYVWKLSPTGSVDKIIPDTEGFLENYSFVRDHVGAMYWADRTKPCQTVMRTRTTNTSIPLGNHCFENIRKIEMLPDGSVFLVDFQDLKKIDTHGNLTTIASKIANKQWTKSTIEHQNAVMGIWADRSGNMYTAISSERMIKRFGPDGKEEIVLKTTFPWSPSGGMVDAKGRLWVLEYDVVNSVRVERIESGKRIIY